LSFLLYPTRECAVFQDGPPLLWQLGPYVGVFQRPELGTTGALLARRVAEDGSEHGDVLIHQLPTGSAPTQGAVEVFYDEWRRATLLFHPNILRTLDSWLGTPPGAEDGAPLPLFFQLVTEYVPGETLSTVLAMLAAKGEHLPVTLALSVAAQLAHGLHAAHEATDEEGRPLDVMHRDVAPAYVLLGYDGGVKLSGFGIARTAVRLMSGPIFKHVGSQPPEAHRKGGGLVDRRADVYGLGVTLYEALTGVDPFRRPLDYDSLQAAMSGDAPPPSDHRPELPPEVDAVVMRAMAPKAGDRYATAAELAQALEQLRATLAPPGDGSEELAAFLRELFGWRRKPGTATPPPPSWPRRWSNCARHWLRRETGVKSWPHSCASGSGRSGFARGRASPRWRSYGPGPRRPPRWRPCLRCRSRPMRTRLPLRRRRGSFRTRG